MKGEEMHSPLLKGYLYESERNNFSWNLKLAQRFLSESLNITVTAYPKIDNSVWNLLLVLVKQNIIIILMNDSSEDL